MTFSLGTKLDAFTLLELLVTLSVIGILAAIGVPYGASRVCDARHNALASGIDTELFNARLFAMENNRYTRVNVEPTASGGVSIVRFYSIDTHSSCAISPSGSGSVLLSSRNFSAVNTVGMGSSYFCMSNNGILVDYSYNSAAVVEHSCGSRDYKLRLNYIGKVGFFILEENLPFMQAGTWRVI